MSSLPRSEGKLSLRLANSARPRLSSGTATATSREEQQQEEDQGKALRQARSLFLCSKSILSIRHIQHLEEMTGLRSLSLHMNFVRRVEGLESLRQLTELDLSGNEIHTLDSGCFRGQAQLVRLNLSSNFLAVLPGGVLDGLGRLEWLSLGYNALATVQGGLASIPATAPLLCVDLCGNNISRLEDVIGGLAAHRAQLTELRLQTPQQQAMPGGGRGGEQSASGAAPSPAMCVFNAFAAPTVRENPFCYETFPESDGTPAVAAAASDRALWRAAATTRRSKEESHNGNSNSSQQSLRMSYVEKVLQAFPRLVVLNGVTFGIDPVQAIMQQRQQQREEDGMRSGRQEEESPPAAGRVPPARKLTFAAADGRSPPTSTAERTTTSSAKHSAAPESLAEQRHEQRPRTISSSSGWKNRDRSSSQGRRRSVKLSLQSSPNGAGGGLTPSVVVADSVEASPGSAAALTPSPGKQHLQWRPKRVSRGTNTESGGDGDITDSSITVIPISSPGASPSPLEPRQQMPDSNSAATAAAAVTLAAAEEETKRLSLQLRLAAEADLRRGLEAQTAAAVAAVEDRHRGQQQRLEQRVATLKDELVRRAGEVAIMRRTRQADLAAQAAATEAHWREVLAGREAAAQLLTAEEAAKAHRATEVVQRQRDSLQSELDGWKSEYERLRAHCEGTMTQLATAKTDRRRADRHWGDVVGQIAGLLGAETDGRRAVEREAAAVYTSGVEGLARCSQAEKAALVEEWARYQETWEGYAKSLQGHYKEVLSHAEHEAGKLRQQLDALKAHLRLNDRRRAEVEVVPNAATVTPGTTDAGCDPIHPTAAAAEPYPPPPVPSSPSADDPLYAATTYWRDAAARHRDDATRLTHALQLSESAGAAVGVENTRLMGQLAEAGEAARAADGERETLLRGLHNLQQDLGKKDAALDELEAEARGKIDEKRRAIAALEERLEGLLESQEKATEAAVQRSDELSAAQRLAAEEAARREAAERQAAQLTAALELFRGNDSGSSSGGLSPADRRRVEVEQARLVSALTVAREQLVRLQDSHRALSQERDAAAAALQRCEREVEEGRRQLLEARESGRLRQRATFEVLSQIMLADGA